MTKLCDFNVILILTKLQLSSNIYIDFADPMKLLLMLQIYDVRPTYNLPLVGVMAVAFIWG